MENKESVMFFAATYRWLAKEFLLTHPQYSKMIDILDRILDNIILPTFSIPVEWD